MRVLLLTHLYILAVRLLTLVRFYNACLHVVGLLAPIHPYAYVVILIRLLKCSSMVGIRMKSAEDQSIPTALTFIIILRSRDWVGDYVHTVHVYCTYLGLLSQSHCVCVSKYM